MSSRQVTVDALLAQRGWVRALARTLVFDDASADDVEQETWLAALSRPPREGGSLRAWFASVVRNRVRDRRRLDVHRAARETAAARPEATASAADLAAATEIHRRLAAALLALEEPYRSAVILRYFEDLPPREIAARTGVPVETARTHVKRGVERLRRRLDADADGREWRALLAPLALGRSGAATAGGTIVATKKTAAIAAILLLVVGFGVALRLVADDDAAATAAPAAPAATPRPTRAARAPADATPPTTTTTAGPAPAAPKATRDRPELLIVDAATKKPLADAYVSVVHPDGGHSTGRSGADGRRELHPTSLGATAVIWASAPGHARRRMADVRLAAEELTIALDPVEPARLRFVTETGRELDATEVLARFGGAVPRGAFQVVADDAFRAGDVAHMLRVLFGPWREWRTDAELDGSSSGLTGGLSDGRWRLFVDRPGAAAWLSEPLGAETTIVVPLPEAPRTRRVRFVADDTKAPLARALVLPWYELGPNSAALPGAETSTDAQGVVVIAYEPPTSRGSGPRPTWCLRSRPPGRSAMVDAWRAIDAAGDADPVEIEVRKSVVVEGEAYLPSGLPAVERRVVTADKCPIWSAVVEEDGRFRITDVPAHDGRVDLMLYAGDSFAQAGAAVGDDGVARVVIGTKAAPGTRGRVSGVVTTGGAPLVGAFVVDQPVGAKGTGFVRTDAAGRFALDGLDAAVLHDFVVYLGDPQASDSACRIRTASPLRLDPAKPLEFAIDLPAGAVRAAVVDADTGAAVRGVRVVAVPAETSFERPRFPGFDFGAGWAGFTGEDGTLLLRALPPGAAHRVEASAEGYEPAVRDGVVPGAAEAPAALEIRLAKKR